jgi:large subunit ribosomal protein L22
MAAARRTSSSPLETSANEVTTEFRAQARWVRTAPRKAQLVVSEIRGKSVVEAQTLLAFMTRSAARDVEKVLRSAVANAESHPTDSYAADQLYVTAAYVGSGPTLKRWRARARGRVGRIKKRTCHITIRLAPFESESAVVHRAPEQEQPQPTRRAKREAPAPEAAAVPALAEEAAVEAAEEPPVEPAPAEAKPKRARSVRKKVSEPESPAEPEAAAKVEAADESQTPSEEKPKRTRSRKKAEPPPATDEGSGEEKED